MEYETKESHEERAKDIKIIMTISGQESGKSHGEPIYGPRTKEIKVVDTKRGDEKVLDAESFSGMKSQFTWFTKDMVRKVAAESGNEYFSDLMLSSHAFEAAYKELKNEVKGVFMDKAPENSEDRLPERFKEKSDVDFEVTGELSFNCNGMVEIWRQDGNKGEGYNLEVEE